MGAAVLGRECLGEDRWGIDSAIVAVGLFLPAAALGRVTRAEASISEGLCPLTWKSDREEEPRLESGGTEGRGSRT